MCRNSRLILIVTAFLGFGGNASAQLPVAVNTFIEKRCLECHDGTSKKGGLDLSTLKADSGDKAIFDKWVRIHDRVHAGEMPPPKKEPLPAKEREAMIDGLAKWLSSADQKRQREAGRVPLRRLNRTEYENTMRDLFAMPGLEVKDLLPEDGTLSGFDKASTALDVSAVQLRKYLEAADYVLDAAIVHQDRPMVFKQRVRLIGGLSQFGESMFPMKDRKVDLDLVRKIRDPLKPENSLKLSERLPYIEAMESLGTITHARPSYEPNVGNFSPYHAGFYRIRMSVWSFDYKRGEVMPASRQQSFALTANGRLLGYFDAPSLKSQEHEIVVWLNAAERLQLNPANLWPNYSNPFGYAGAAVAVDWVDVEGPLNDTWPPASHRALFGALPLAPLSTEKGRPLPHVPAPPVRHPGSRPNHVDAKEFQKNQPVWTAAASRPRDDAERLLRDFLPRAFRRPVADEELAVYVKIARARIDEGDFFESAMRTSFRIALCSPDFLYHQEPAVGKDPTVIDTHALACRLSYLLWNSKPDNVLEQTAAQNKLGGKLLTDQAERMLADPRSERFINDFLDQWLDLRKIDFTTPDTSLYPEFRPDVRDAMLAESRAYFRAMIDKDLGIAHVVDSDFLMINQRLAELYGIPGVVGSAIRAVPKPKDCMRGGFLTQGAILKVTANGTSTSPVQRGVWVVDRLYGRPPQPPPPDIAAVDPDLNGTTTIREQLAKHRSSASCAGCHAKFDPHGFALENFDVIGRSRTRYRHMGEQGDSPDVAEFIGFPGNGNFEKSIRFHYGLPVDASGETSDGKAFKNVSELRAILLADNEALARNFVERLILYGTGAPVSFADRAQVEQILKASRDGGYGVRSLLLRVIQSPLFRRH